MSRHWKEPSDSPDEIVVSKWYYYVYVCSFTFRFDSLAQIEEYQAYFSQKIHPSARYKQDPPTPPQSYEYGVRHTKFDRLPLYLFEEPKRQKVLKAFEKALDDFSKNS